MQSTIWHRQISTWATAFLLEDDLPPMSGAYTFAFGLTGGYYGPGDCCKSLLPNSVAVWMGPWSRLP